MGGVGLLLFLGIGGERQGSASPEAGEDTGEGVRGEHRPTPRAVNIYRGIVYM